MTNLYPYLKFESTKDALEYYETVFGATDINRLAVGQEQAAQFGVSEEEAPNLTMHSDFNVAGLKLMASDAFGDEIIVGSNISLMIDYDINNKEQDEVAQNLFDKVKDHESITVEMPLEKQFWGGKMGAFTDKYGIKWMIHGQQQQ
nr:glyoxalase/bleomycin resistance/extradiol dioxygenase family protein [Mammaliicoccus sp. Marseille-Q6498]